MSTGPPPELGAFRYDDHPALGRKTDIRCALREGSTQSIMSTPRATCSANRMLVEPIEDGMEAQKRKHQQFFEFAERFRGATDPGEVKRLGDELGRMVFGA